MEIDVNTVTLITGGIGATGSIAGAIAGTLLGIKLSNTKPDIDVFVDHKAWMYYPSRGFAMYLPVTVINEGSKSGTIKDFEVTLTSPTKQSWNLKFSDFGIDTSDASSASWGKGKDARPILCHGKSGNQYILRLENFDLMSCGRSDVEIVAGKYEITLDVLDRKGKTFISKTYTLTVGSEAKGQLTLCRNEPQRLTSYYFGISECAD
ncbi:hypothetical protein OQJ65_21805 [Vibrio sp. Sgm 22]|uniref:hypothetical protein n=1 Tax=unclassified Vibrio TaxID=2614977 RepID=UPI002248AC21|nr:MULTISPECIES: hypothetical protein [unclassified Vibrio]MCX2761028.1 hypothetical protein [Vibrio sp. 14G-20]MCX2777948.1 hypothetical protein [Vibrio sp. Sgm 22]